VLKYITVKTYTRPLPTDVTDILSKDPSQTWQTLLGITDRDRHYWASQTVTDIIGHHRPWQTLVGITDRDGNRTIIWQSVVGSLIRNHHRPRQTVWYPLLPHQRPWQTPRTSITVSDGNFSDCLKCTVIYVVFGMCEVYRSIWISKLYTVVCERTISSHI
jgi:hypothetical protein